MNIPLVTRFAPSPTGHLHLGHVISMAYVFGIGWAKGAKVLLRMEDHDRERYREEYERSILDDMAWLGFIPDNWEEFSSIKKQSDYRQSNSLHYYQSAIKCLEAQSKTYYCSCSRKQMQDPPTNTEPKYKNTCRNKQLAPSINHGLRLMLDDREECFFDQLQGSLKQHPASQCGDFLLMDRRGNFTYNFAVVVDDIRHGVNLIIRGEDILHCTGRQLTLRRFLGNESIPHFLHHPLAVDEKGIKLSKRTFAAGIVKRRLANENPHAVLGEALHLVGLIDHPMPIKPKELPEILQESQLIPKPLRGIDKGSLIIERIASALLR